MNKILVKLIMSKINKSKVKEEMLTEMLDKQLPDVTDKWKLKANDVSRICERLDKSIFGDDCAIYSSSKASKKCPKKCSKIVYTNFFIDGEKKSLHRLLHFNYKGPLKKTVSLKGICKNRNNGCQTLNHYKKKYNAVVSESESSDEEVLAESKPKNLRFRLDPC